MDHPIINAIYTQCTDLDKSTRGLQPYFDYDGIPCYSLVFGLPTKSMPTGSHGIKIENLLDPNLKTSGHLHTSNISYPGERGVFFEAITSPIEGPRSKADCTNIGNFVTNDGNLCTIIRANVVTGAMKPFILSYSEALTMESFGGTFVICGGHYFTDQSIQDEPEEVKCFIDYNRCIFTTSTGLKIPFSKSYVALEHKADRNIYHKYEIKIVPLTSLRIFKYTNKPENYCEIQGLISTEPIPETEIEKAQSNQLNPSTNIIVKCSNGEADVPDWLRNFFVQSPVFAETQEQFRGSGRHDISADSLKLLIGWLIGLVNNRNFPSLDDLLKNDFNIDEWIHTANYCGIPVLEEFFGRIKEVASK